MVSPDRMARSLRSGVAIIAVLALAGGTARVVLAQSPRPATRTPAAQAAPNPAAARQRDQELDSVRAEQRRSQEAEQRLATENDAIAQERRKLNQSVIEAATRIRSTEERIAAMEIHLRQLESGESDLRKSLEGRRGLIAEILAALQRIGHRPPPAVFVGSDDAVESVRTAMSLGACLLYTSDAADE